MIKLSYALAECQMNSNKNETNPRSFLLRRIPSFNEILWRKELMVQSRIKLTFLVLLMFYLSVNVLWKLKVLRNLVFFRILTETWILAFFHMIPIHFRFGSKIGRLRWESELRISRFDFLFINEEGRNILKTKTITLGPSTNHWFACFAFLIQLFLGSFSNSPKFW